VKRIMFLTSIFILFLCGCPITPTASAQTTTVTAAVVDSDSTAWVNGTWNLAFVPNPSNPNPANYNINGAPLSPSVTIQNGTMSGSGILSVTVYQQSAITPIGSSWQLTVCPMASSACGIYNFTAVGSSMNVSSAINAIIKAPRFNAIAGTYGYVDVEAINTKPVGGTYWNVISSCQRYYNGSSFVCPSTTGGVTSVTPGTNVNCTPNTGGSCTGAIVINATGGSGAAAIYYYPTLYGAVADMLPQAGTFWTYSLSGNTLTCSSCDFTTAVNDGLHYVKLSPNSSSWSPGQPFSTAPGNISQIASYISATQITLALTSSTNSSGFIQYGTDNTPALNTCYAIAYATTFGGMCMYPVGQYLFATAPNNITFGAFYTGDYGQSSGGTGSYNSAGHNYTIVTCNPSGGHLIASGCAVSDYLTSYKYNATLSAVWLAGGCAANVPVWNYGPCGWATISDTTNGTGVPQTAGISIVNQGQQITTPVIFGLIPIGGDGGSLHSSLTSGTMNLPTSNANGNGYNPVDGTITWYTPVNTADNCTTWQTWGGTNYSGGGTVNITSGGALGTTVIMTHAPTGCTIVPTIIVGPASCNTGTFSAPVWSQCTNIAPLFQSTLPTKVVETLGVGFGGSQAHNLTGFNITGSWDGVTVDSGMVVTQSAFIAGYAYLTTQEGTSPSGDFIERWDANDANYSYFSDNNIGGGIGYYTTGMDLWFEMYHNSFAGETAHVNGGTYCERIDVVNECGGYGNADQENSTVIRSGAYAGTGSLDDEIDQWFDRHVWRSGDSAYSVDFAAGQQSPTPLTPIQTQTSHVIGTPQAANFFPFLGITKTCWVNMARGGRGGGFTEMHDSTCKNGARGWIGYFSGFDVWGFSMEGGNATVANNYQLGSILPGWIDFDDNGSVLYAPNSTGAVTAANYMLFSQQTQGVPIQTEWHQLNCSSGGGGSCVNPENALFLPLSSIFPMSYGGIFGGNVNAIPSPAIFQCTYTNAWHNCGSIVGQYNGLEITCGNSTSLDCIDILANGLFTNIPLILTQSTPTVSISQVGLGTTTVASSFCNQGGVLSSVAGCLVVNVAGRTSYVPYF
jgi:hypothetical protein